MKYAKLVSLLLAVAFFWAASALAGDSVYSDHAVVRVHHVRPAHPALAPFVFVSRAFDTFLHAPQILAEGIEGDRALVNHRGFLAPREVPVEDCIISPAD